MSGASRWGRILEQKKGRTAGRRVGLRFQLMLSPSKNVLGSVSSLLEGGQTGADMAAGIRGV